MLLSSTATEAARARPSSVRVVAKPTSSEDGDEKPASQRMRPDARQIVPGVGDAVSGVPVAAPQMRLTGAAAVTLTVARNGMVGDLRSERLRCLESHAARQRIRTEGDEGTRPN